MLIKNFIGGMKDSYSGYFSLKSRYYDYELSIPNSSAVDLACAISNAKKAVPLCKIHFAKRREILLKAADELEYNGQEVEHFVKMLGMPKRYVVQRLRFAKKVLSDIADVVTKRHGEKFGEIARSHLPHGYDMMIGDGVACAFIPPNDPAEVSFVIAHAVMAGIPLILKPSQLEPYNAIKIAQIVERQGYPGINILHWKTSDPQRANMSQKLIEETQRRIIMGDYNTAQRLLIRKDEDEKIIWHALGEGRNCILSAGKSKTIIADCPDIDSAVSETVDCSFSWTNDCVTAKVAVLVSNSEISQKFVQKAVQKVCGDPLDDNTEIGYVEKNVVDEIFNAVENAVKFGKIKLLTPLTRISPNQFMPIVLEVFDSNSEFVNSEMPYVLALYHADSMEQAKQFINSAAQNCPEKKSMCVAVYSQTAVPNGLDSYMVCMNKPSMDGLSPYLPHQGYDMTAFLTDTIAIHIK